MATRTRKTKATAKVSDVVETTITAPKQVTFAQIRNVALKSTFGLSGNEWAETRNKIRDAQNLVRAVDKYKAAAKNGEPEWLVNRLHLCATNVFNTFQRRYGVQVV